MEKRKWSKDDKLAILKEASENGVEVTIRKHGVYPSTYYSWRKRYQLEGEAGFTDEIYSAVIFLDYLSYL
jgi:putative transposase